MRSSSGSTLVIACMSRNSMLKTDITSVSSKDFLDTQAIKDSTSKHVYGLIKTCNLMLLLLLFEQIKIET